MRASGGILFFLLLGALAAAAEAPYAIGERIAAFELEDQFGEAGVVDESVRFLLFSRDMEGGKILRRAVEGQTRETLAGLRAVYVADIHRMPGLIARIFAIPRMRRRGYPMLLDREGVITERLPDREGEATVLELNHLTLVAVHHFDDPEAVRTQLGLAPAMTGGD